jgi:hypothetical protein
MTEAAQRAIVTGLIFGAAPTTLLALTLLWAQRRHTSQPPTPTIRIGRCPLALVRAAR